MKSLAINNWELALNHQTLSLPGDADDTLKDTVGELGLVAA